MANALTGREAAPPSRRGKGPVFGCNSLQGNQLHFRPALKESGCRAHRRLEPGQEVVFCTPRCRRAGSEVKRRKSNMLSIRGKRWQIHNSNSWQNGPAEKQRKGIGNRFEIV